jgi:3-hydroxyacyl-CoA dehydrogenase/enoyl-CoA hydratase/3-hydroxybutyryl-CoA epimerase
MHVPDVLWRMLDEGMFGRKKGGGFYVHEKGKTAPNPAAASFRDPVAPITLNRAAMQRRMVLLMVNEAARCIEEQVVAEPADADFGMIMGAGFAPFRGGPLRYADALGVGAVTAALHEEAARSGAHFTPCQLLQEMTETNRSFYATS